MDSRSLRPSACLTAVAPRNTSSFGPTSSSDFFRYGRQVSASSVAGWRFSGGRHLTTLRMRKGRLVSRQAPPLAQPVHRLAGPPDERLALRVFVGPRPFSDQDGFRPRVAAVEDQVGAGLRQAALRAAGLQERLAEFPVGLGAKERVGGLVEEIHLHRCGSPRYPRSNPER